MFVRKLSTLFKEIENGNQALDLKTGNVLHILDDSLFRSKSGHSFPDNEETSFEDKSLCVGDIYEILKEDRVVIIKTLEKV